MIWIKDVWCVIKALCPTPADRERWKEEDSDHGLSGGISDCSCWGGPYPYCSKCGL